MTAQAFTTRPEVFGQDLRRFWNLTWTLAITDYKLKFFGSVLGVVWTLARPFAMFGVLYVVFVEIAKVGDGVINYPAYILLCMVLFQFFGEVVGGCVDCLTVRENLLRKMRFPRLVIPVSVGLTALLNLGTTLVAVALFLAITGVYPNFGWLELIPIVFLVAVFALGVGLLLGALFVRYRDIKPIWEVGSQMLFYASPILYVATKQVPQDWLQIYLCNPLASLFTQLRHALLDPSASSAFEAMPNGKILIPFGIVVGSFVIGSWVFMREAPRVAENL